MLHLKYLLLTSGNSHDFGKIKNNLGKDKGNSNKKLYWLYQTMVIVTNEKL